MNNRFIMTAFYSLILTTGTQLSAHNELQHVMRGLSPVEEVEVQEQRLAVMPEEVRQNPSIEQLLRAQYYDDAQYIYRIHPYAYYSLKQLSGPADFAKLQDGSFWFVKPAHRYIIKSWAQDHEIFIKPNAYCFSLYRYVLYNRTANEVVEVNLRDLKEPFFINTVHKIGSIDAVNGIITLDDGTNWRMNPRDRSYVNWWMGDRILVGTNNNWRTQEFPHVLINASIANNTPYCEADYFSY